MKAECYGWAHKTAKRLLRRSNDLPATVKLVSFPESVFDPAGLYRVREGRAGFLNETDYEVPPTLRKAEVYPVENLVRADFDGGCPVSFAKRGPAFPVGVPLKDAAPLWAGFLESAAVPQGYRNGGCRYAGFIREAGEWCLPSWIWTNAAEVRYYCLAGEVDKAAALGDRLMALQQDCGGWIVRNDYGREGVTPQLAPNDSCYIAQNCCLALYAATGEARYLSAARRTAAWVMETARPDGMVWFSFDCKREKWITDRNIVDTGFTAGLFAGLYEATREEEYAAFLRSFAGAYVRAFYSPEQRRFATAIDGNGSRYGGAFARGQGWALEGLVPAYRVLRDAELKTVIHDTAETLLRLQAGNGGWAYNLLKPMMGQDCKAAPVIARRLIEWYETEEQDPRYLKAARKALEWCAAHTAASGPAKGGIFSYTVEGAIVHHMYTSTAFTYACAYALEAARMLKKLDEEQGGSV